MEPSEGIEAILTNAGIAGVGVTGWPIAISRHTIAPDQQVAIIDVGGKRPEVLIAQNYPGIQIIVRGAKEGNGYPVAKAKAREIFDYLQALPTPNAHWTELASCVARTDIVPAGYDDYDRPLISLNFDLIVAPTVEGNRIY